MSIREYIKVLPLAVNPNPEFYCPLNGYIKDPAVYVPPIPIPSSTDECIILICNAANGNFDLQNRQIELLSSGGSPTYTYKVYDSNNTLVDTITSTIKWINFNFPSSSGYYTVKITLPTGYHFWNFRNGSASVGTTCCYEHIIFNTPNLRQLGLAGLANLKSVEFKTAIPELYSLSRTFEHCYGIEYFMFPAGEYLTMNNTPAVFNSCYGLKSVDMSGMILQKPADGQNFLSDWTFGNARNCTDIKLPANYPFTRFYYMFSGTLKLTNLQMFTSNDALQLDSFCANVFYNCGYEGEIVFPELRLKANTNISDFFNGCRAKKVKMVGDWSNVTLANYCFNNMPLVEEIEAPRKLSATILTGSSCFNTHPQLKKYIGPDVGFMGVPVGDCPLQSITGESDTPTITGINQASVTIPTGPNVLTALTELQMIKLRVRNLRVGTTAATKFVNLTTLEIDWANSGFADVSPPQLAISANLSAAEINRIFNSLPIVTAKVLNLWFCTGYASADKTIASNKGWLLGETPSINTVAATNITRNAAILGGSNILTLTTYPITAKGVCWSLTPTPTTASSKATSTANTADFTVNASGLTANSLYYFRAYAVNSLGTSYGQELTFTSLP